MPHNETAPSTVAAALGAKAVVEFFTPSSTANPNPRPLRNASRKARTTVTALVAGYRFTVTGQVAKALMALVEAGTRGVTALEVATWAYRMGAYVFTLRRLHGLVIETEHEPHDGGWHARYVLRSSVELVEVRP